MLLHGCRLFFLLFSGVGFFHAAVPLVGPCWFTRLFRVFVSAAGSLEYIVSSTLTADVHAYFNSCHGLSQQWSGTVENPHWLCSANGRSRAKENYGVRGTHSHHRIQRTSQILSRTQ